MITKNSVDRIQRVASPKVVENLFCRVKDYSRITLRKCKTSRSYGGFAFALVNLQFCP